MALNDIKHFFVLMMENRSFDHMLGASGITGIDADTGMPTSINCLSYTLPEATFAVQPDPPHEFDDVLIQLCGKKASIDNYPNNSYPPVSNTPVTPQGFLDSYQNAKPKGDIDDPIYYPTNPPPFDPKAVIKCYTPQSLPVLNTLAKQFAVCDNWFSSIPGPTWPNRYFLHAGTSGGVVASPHSFCSFSNGTIFDKLDDKGIVWKVYHHGLYTQILSIEGMLKNLRTDKFRSYVKDFQNDINNPSTFNASYIFIEPDHSNNGNSQHPIQDIRNGELLIKDIYTKLTKSPIWESSALIILYDEHGGFYDHVQPPEVNTQDTDISNAHVNKTSNQKNFKFDRYGVRVPAIVISPYTKFNTIDHVKYDHTSVSATLKKRFNLGSLGQTLLSERAEKAATFEKLFSLKAPRTDIPSLENIIMSPEPLVVSDNNNIGDTLNNYLQLVKELDLRSAEDANIQQSITDMVARIKTVQDAHSYIESVSNRLLT